jgi:hypothetical protein
VSVNYSGGEEFPSIRSGEVCQQQFVLNEVLEHPTRCTQISVAIPLSLTDKKHSPHPKRQSLSVVLFQTYETVQNHHRPLNIAQKRRSLVIQTAHLILTTTIRRPDLALIPDHVNLFSIVQDNKQGQTHYSLYCISYAGLRYFYF